MPSKSVGGIGYGLPPHQPEIRTRSQKRLYRQRVRLMMAEEEEVDAPSAPSCWDGEVEEMSKAMSEARLKKQEEDENDYYSEEFPSLEAATERQKK